METRPQARLINSIIKRHILEANSVGIARRELAKKVELDIRTVTSYCDRLIKYGVINSESITNGRGRPAVYYRSNIKKMMFLGIYIMRNKIHYLLLSGQKSILTAGELDVQGKNESQATTINRLVQEIYKIKDLFPNRALAAIGFSISRHYHDSMMLLDIVSNFIETLKRELNIPILRDKPINAGLYRMFSLFHSASSIVAIHPGKTVELGMIVDGHLVSDAEKAEYELQHLQVDPAGKQCYCGQNGCLVNYISHGALAEQYNQTWARAGKKTNYKYEDFIEKLDLKEEKAVKVARTVGGYLGVALKSIVEKHNFDLMFLLRTPEIIIEFAQKKYLELGGDPKVKLENFYFYNSDNTIGAAEMAYCYILDVVNPFEFT